MNEAKEREDEEKRLAESYRLKLEEARRELSALGKREPVVVEKVVEKVVVQEVVKYVEKEKSSRAASERTNRSIKNQDPELEREQESVAHEFAEQVNANSPGEKQEEIPKERRTEKRIAIRKDEQQEEVKESSETLIKEREASL